MEGAERAEPRPGMRQHDVAEWKANPVIHLQNTKKPWQGGRMGSTANASPEIAPMVGVDSPEGSLGVLSHLSGQCLLFLPYPNFGEVPVKIGNRTGTAHAQT